MLSLEMDENPDTSRVQVSEHNQTVLEPGTKNRKSLRKQERLA